MTENDLFETARMGVLPDDVRVPLEQALDAWRADELTVAKQACDVALERATRAEHRFGVFHALQLRACVAYSEGDHALSRALHQEVLRRSNELGFLGGMGASLCGLAMIDLAEGDLDAARVHHERALACFEDGGYAERAAAARTMWAAAAHAA